MNDATNMIPPRYLVVAAMIFLLAFSLRVGATARFVGLSSPPDRDAGGLDVVDYEGFAWSLVSGKGYALEDGTPTARRTPGTSFAIAIPYVLFGRNYQAAHLWFCFLSAITCVGAAALGELCLRGRYAALAGLGLALYPGHIYASMHFFSEVPYALSVCAGTYFSIRAVKEPRTAWAVFAGIAWGFSAICRPNIVLVFPFIGLAALTLTGLSRRTLTVVAVQLFVAGALVSPWVMRNYLVFGKPTIATVVGGFTFWGANNSHVLNDPQLRGDWYFGEHIVDAEHPLTGSEVEQEQASWDYGWEFVRTHAAQMPALTCWKLYRLFTPFEATPNRTVYWAFAASWSLLAPFFVVGLIVGLYRSLPIALVLQSTWWATIATAVLFYGSVRFRDGIAPITLVICAWGLQAVVDRLAAKRRTPDLPS